MKSEILLFIQLILINTISAFAYEQNYSIVVSGPTMVCPNTTVTYSVYGADQYSCNVGKTYSWMIYPGYGQMVSGGGPHDDFITLYFDEDIFANMSVIVNLMCGDVMLANNALTNISGGNINPLATSASRCDPGPVTLTATPPNVYSTLRWYKNASGGTPIDHGNNFTTPYLTETTTYYVSAYSAIFSCQEGPRVPATAYISLDPPVIDNPLASCGTTNATLTATPSGGANTIRWYAQSTGGTPIAHGTSFTTPSSSSPTAYYASSYNTLTKCESPRAIAVGLTVAPPEVSDQSRCGSGSVALRAAPAINAHVIRWYETPTGGVPFEGEIFNTPFLQESKTYYVSSYHRYAKCESARVPVSAIIDYTIPSSPTGVTGNSRFGPGILVLSAEGSLPPEGKFNWYNKEGMFVGSGSTYSTEITTNDANYLSITIESASGCESAPYIVEVTLEQFPSSDPDDDFDRNWSMVHSFDEEGNVIGASKQFYDVLGRPTQTQIKTLANQNVVAVQQIYDAYGAAVLSTLPAPINNQAFNYKEAFIANPVGNEYSLLDFDIPNYMNNPGEVNFPKPVGKTEQGSLGWYYSDNNFLEPLVATTGYPYSRTVEIKGPEAEIVQYSAPGDIYKTGSGYEGKNKRLKADLGEIQHYFDLRHHFIPNSTANLESAIYKNISVDLGGHETIQYTDAGGRAIVSAIGGGIVRSITKTPSELDNTFHIPEGISNASITIEVQGSSGSIFDLINKKNISYFPMPPGQYVIAPGFYETNRISSITYPTNYQNYSYNYYNDIGQLVATVAPEGVKLNSTAYPSFVTTYAYDQLGRMIAVTSPDEGTSRYVYSLDGKIRFSQNEEQRNSTPPRFSYTNYDNIGRLVESGEYTMSGTGYFIFEPHSAVTGNTKSVHAIVDNIGAAGALDAARCSDVTKMHYDLQTPDFVPDGLHPQQHYLYNQVAKTGNENTKTWYSYDEFGQLEWMKQEIAGLGTKTIDYTYDFGGNVLEVAFQKGEDDAFYHHYTYDADQRLYQVFTSKDGETKQLQATYSYYLHGPLKRVELAEGLQGIDYVYTITGALKAINHADPTRDPGQDGTGAEHGDVGHDVFGMTLSYHDGDYVGAGYDAGEMTVPNHDDQYGGAIKAISWHNGTETGNSRTYAYAYDEKYQLLNASWGEMTGTAAYSFAKDPSSAHQVLIPGYDKHGNIQNLLRKGSVGNILGSYAYNYQAGTNKLTGINHQGTPLVSYGYDAIGRTIAQTEAGNTMHLVYDAYGMVKIVKDQNDNLKVRFLYDDKGMRLCKETYDATGTLALKTWYVRDAAGNVMAIYQEDAAASLPAEQAEVPIYGASRLAVYKPQMQTTFYEIKDHLGSVRAVIGATETAHYMATMEAPAESGESADFPNYHMAKKISADMYNYTAAPSANRSIRLSGIEGEVIGLAKSLKVYPGDTIAMEVFGKYFAPTNQNTTAVGDMAAALAGAFELAPNTLEALPAYNAINTLFQPGPLLGAVDWEDDAAPKAFINYILFDDDFIPYDFGFDQIDVGALEDGSGVPHDLMSVEAVATRPGHIYIYLSNESDRVVDVYFDDMMVTHTYSPIVAGADYYPFGLPMEGREVAQEDWRWGYQGAFAEQDGETGYSAFALRQYDARFGRWMSTDPYGQYWSPYVGMGNMPQMSFDADGGWSWAAAGIGAVVGGGIGYVASDGDWRWALAGAAGGGAIGGASFSRVPAYGIGGSEAGSLMGITGYKTVASGFGRGVLNTTLDVATAGSRYLSSGSPVPTIFVSVYNTPKGFKQSEYFNSLSSRLIENDFSSNLNIAGSSVWGRVKAWWNNAPTASVTIRNFRLGSDKLGIGGYAIPNDPHSVIIYNGLSDQGKKRTIPMFQYVNATMHELGHALFGLIHDAEGHTSDPSSIMDYRSAYKPGANFNGQQRAIIRKSIWGQ